MVNYLIVGVDPGTTTALAGIDLRGNLVFSWSKKNASEREIIEKIIEYGQPIIFTSDKRKVPSLIKKLSDRFLVDYFVPSKDLSVKLKKNLIEEFNLKSKIKNIHELDAVASALFYYKRNKNKIEYLLNKFGEKAIDLLKYGYIKEIKEEKEKIKEPIKIREVGKFTEKDETIYNLKKELLFKNLYIKKLKNKIEKLKSKIKQTNLKYKKCFNYCKNKYLGKIKALEVENRKLENKIKYFGDLLEGINKGELVLLWDWKLRYYTKLSFIREEDLELIDKNELNKFKKLVKSNDLSWFEDFGNVIVAKKREVDNALTPKDDEIKKIKEYFTIYKLRRKNKF